MRIIIAVRGSRLNENSSGAGSVMGRVPYLHTKYWGGGVDLGPHIDGILKQHILCG